MILGFLLLGAGGLRPPATPPLVARALSFDRALSPAGPCAEAAPVELVVALRNGVSLRWREADALLPDLHVERALVRRVEVRAGGVGLCDGRVVVTDPVFTMRGRRGEPVEVVLATALRPTLGTALTPDGEGPAPAAGTMQVTRRDAFTAYGAWDLGSWDGS